MLFGWLPAMWLAHRVRRRNYELFYSAHRVVLLLIPVAYYHSWHLWQYSYVGVGLLAYSKAAGALQARQGLTVAADPLPASAVSGRGVTRLRLARQDGGRLGHVAGQFVWLRVPAVDSEWHPFTVSSAPAGPQPGWTHLIQDQGAGTWTGRLYQLATQNAVGPVQYHGPYGAPPFSLAGGTQPLDETAVVFVAGGVGITPIAAILAEWLAALQLAAAAAAPEEEEGQAADARQGHGLAAALAKAPPVAKVLLVWALREPSLALELGPALLAPLLAAAAGRFELRLHYTGSSTGGPAALATKDAKHPACAERPPPGAEQPEFRGLRGCVFRGRVQELGPLLKETAAAGGGGRLGVYACGPPALVAAAAGAAAAVAADVAQPAVRYHAEVFAF